MSHNSSHISYDPVSAARVSQLSAMGSQDGRSNPSRRAYPPAIGIPEESEAEKTRKIELAIRMAEEERQKLQPDAGVPSMIPSLPSSSNFPSFSSFKSTPSIPASGPAIDSYDLIRKGKKPRNAGVAKSEDAPLSLSSISSYTDESPKVRRRARKNSRERQRRVELNDQFERLCSLLNYDRKGKIRKTCILSEAISVIGTLRKENQRLRTQHVSHAIPAIAVSSSSAAGPTRGRPRSSQAIGRAITPSYPLPRTSQSAPDTFEQSSSGDEASSGGGGKDSFSVINNHLAPPAQSLPGVPLGRSFSNPAQLSNQKASFPPTRRGISDSVVDLPMDSSSPLFSLDPVMPPLPPSPSIEKSPFDVLPGSKPLELISPKVGPPLGPSLGGPSLGPSLGPSFGPPMGVDQHSHGHSKMDWNEIHLSSSVPIKIEHDLVHDLPTLEGGIVDASSMLDPASVLLDNEHIDKDLEKQPYKLEDLHLSWIPTPKSSSSSQQHRPSHQQPQLQQSQSHPMKYNPKQERQRELLADITDSMGKQRSNEGDESMEISLPGALEVPSWDDPLSRHLLISPVGGGGSSVASGLSNHESAFDPFLPSPRAFGIGALH